MKRAALALLLAACASQPACPPVDEAAIAARVREEVLAEIAAQQAEQPPEEPEEPDPYQRARVDTAHAPWRGASEPLVTIVAFIDYQCPFSARAMPTMARLLEQHPEDVQLVVRHQPLPFHTNAMQAAAASLEAYDQGGNEVFWRYHDLLFANQAALSRADLERYASQVGISADALLRALDDRSHEPRINTDQQDGNRVGARGTPTFFFNGRPVMGAQPFEVFERMVTEEIALARRDLRRGVSRSQIYARRMERAVDGAVEGFEQPPSRPSTPREEPDPNAIYRVPIDGRPVRGSADALVTIVQFTDLQCPFCSRVQPTLRQIEARYGSDVRIVFRHNPLPFHVHAMDGAMIGAEVLAERGASAFFRYTDLAFENQQGMDRDSLLRLAVQAGANRRRVERALEARTHEPAIREDMALAAQLGASGTPSFFINGRNVRGAQPFEAFQRVIDEELARANERMRAGVARNRIYEESIANGATSPQRIVVNPTPTPSAPTPPDRIYTIAIPPSAPTRGPSSARVTIQMYGDFQCPFTGRVRPVIETLLREYPDRVRLVWRDYPLPFHTSAMLAAEAAREVRRQGGDAAFWRYWDLLFDNQAQLDDASLVRLARSIRGIDGRALERALAAHTHRAAVEADMTAMTGAGADAATPSFFINGRLIAGARPIEDFRAAVDRALAAP